MSLVMPVRNGARFLDEAVASVLAQTHRNLELVVVDDGSTDATPALLRDWQRRDARVRILTRVDPNGIAGALDEGVRHSAGDLLARLDADDRAAPDRLRRQVGQFSARPRLGLLGTGARYVDVRGRIVGSETVETGAALVQVLRVGNSVFHPSVMMRRSAYETAGGYRPQAEPAEDLDLWLRIAEHFEVDNLDEPLIDYRLHDGQSTLMDPRRQAVAATAAHWAAEVRATGAPDPLDGIERVDEALLRSHGVGRARISAEQIAALSWTAELCETAGYHSLARAAWRAAQAEATSLGRVEEGRFFLTRARLRRRQGRTLARRVDQIRAITAAPQLIAMSVAWRLRGPSR
ncbi:glycosyltransferase [Geodermatophilus sp. SYSU D00867]